MFGHMIKLMSPDHHNQVAFRILSKKKMRSIDRVMRHANLLERFRDWKLLEFRVEEAKSEQEEPEVLHLEKPPCGSLIDVMV